MACKGVCSNPAEELFETDPLYGSEQNNSQSEAAIKVSKFYDFKDPVRQEFTGVKCFLAYFFYKSELIFGFVDLLDFFPFLRK